jgi:SAM-dependent methyltransferase
MPGPLSPWDRHAAQWSAVGPPLRPSAEDLRLYREALPSGGHVLLLGVTPELARLALDLGARVTALDSNVAMIRAHFPEPPPPGARALLGDWRDIPAPDGAFTAAIGDGFTTVLGSAPAARRALSELRRVLAPGAALVLRHFLRPDPPESSAEVFADLLAGRIPSFHDFKWRLAHALPQDGEAGVRVGDIHAAWEARGLDPSAVAAELGWDPRVVRTIDAYRDLDQTYLFPTLAELSALYAPLFSQATLRFPTYPLGARCPLTTHRAHD